MTTCVAKAVTCGNRNGIPIFYLSRQCYTCLKRARRELKVIARIPHKDLLRRAFIRYFPGCLLAWLSTVAPIPAGYKVRQYAPLPIESYPSRLSSEGLTVAVEPMFTDALAGKAFDKKDIVARGIMPLAIIILNGNEFAVEVAASTIELLISGNRIRSLSPERAFQQIFGQTPIPREVRIPSPVPIPRITVYKSNAAALDDFNYKYLGIKRIEPQSLAAGFIYLPVKNSPNLRKDLAEARVYIPDLCRADNGAPMMFLEIDLRPAIEAIPPK